MSKCFKMTAVLITLVLAMSTVLAACSSDKNKGDSEEALKPGDTLSFSITLPSFGGKVEDAMVQKEWVKKMEEELDLKLDIKYNYIPYSEYQEKLKLMLSSNEMTDLVYIMGKDNFSQYEGDDLFFNLGEYKELLPNYFSRVKEIPDGEIKTVRADGKMYGTWQISLPRQEKDSGVGVYTPAAYRYDIFKKHNIAIPTTIDEFYQAAKTLKEHYPNSYPINTSWNSFQALFSANHTRGPLVYWNGKDYVFGAFEDSYKEALQFANKLYAEQLMDPEIFSDKDDAVKKKLMSGTNLMLLQVWFNNAGDWVRTNAGEEEVVISFFPDNPKYGVAWQDVADTNNVSINSSEIMVVSPKAKHKQELVKLIDLQYREDIIEMITWGIEDTTFVRTDDGKPTFVDSIKKAENPWIEGDKYGMRASSSFRPGFQLGIDSLAFTDFAPNDPGYIAGKVVDMPWEKAFPDTPFPNDFTPPWIFEPYIEFTDDEKEQIQINMSPINTYVEEMQNKFINGKESFDNWDLYKEKVKKTGDIDKVLQIYADALERYKARANK